MASNASKPETRVGVYLLTASALDREAYRLLLEQRLGRHVIATSDFKAVSVWKTMRGRPALAMAVTDRVTAEVRDALGMIPRLCKPTRILAVSDIIERPLLQSWASCAIDGYVVKHATPDELGTAIDTVLSGQPYFSSLVAHAFLRAARQRAPKLTRREAELLPLLARGMTLREAASVMTVSYKTADSYRTSLLRKLGIRDRVELARYAIRERIIDP